MNVTGNLPQIRSEETPLIMNSPVVSNIKQWIANNPTTVKTIEAWTFYMGVGTVLGLPFTIAALGFSAAFTIGILGSLTAAISFVAYYALDLLIPPNHNMKTHTYETGTYGANRLYYQKDIPILELNSDNHLEAGIAHGYLMGKPLNHLLKSFHLLQKFNLVPKSEDIKPVLEEIRSKIPKDYLDELNGIKLGLEKWAEENPFSFPTTVTVDDLIIFHLMPDSIHFDPKSIEHPVTPKNPPERRENAFTPGCTVIIDQDTEKGMTFGRNMDWNSYGFFGTYSLIINRKYKKDKHSTAEVGFPGFVGTLTGMNSQGLSLAMNVCSGDTTKIQGMPAVFFNRMCLENSTSVADVKKHVKTTPPLGSYHLSTADKENAKTFHLFQGSDKHPHIIRKWKPQTPLITTNCRYSFKGAQSCHMHESSARHSIIQDFFKDATKTISEKELKKADLVETSLSLPHVNNHLTVHKVLMNPQHKKMQVAFNNSFTGDSTLQELNTVPLFG